VRAVDRSRGGANARELSAPRWVSVHPSAEIWTRANLSVVEQRIAIADAGGQSFIDKLENQLTGLDPARIQLGAELVFVQMISEADTHGERAREHLARILCLLPQSLALPVELDQGARRRRGP
jgi:hypothetical protein